MKGSSMWADLLSVAKDASAGISLVSTTQLPHCLHFKPLSSS